jgi:hypothetical protein
VNRFTLQDYSVLLCPIGRADQTLRFEQVVDAFLLGIDGTNFQPIDRSQVFTSAKNRFVLSLSPRFETRYGDYQSGYKC